MVYVWCHIPNLHTCVVKPDRTDLVKHGKKLQSPWWRWREICDSASQSACPGPMETRNKKAGQEVRQSKSAEKLAANYATPKSFQPTCLAGADSKRKQG